MKRIIATLIAGLACALPLEATAKTPKLPFIGSADPIEGIYIYI